MRQNLFRNIDMYSNNKAFILAKVTRKTGSMALPGRADKLRLICMTIEPRAPEEATLHYVTQNQQNLSFSLRRSWKIRTISAIEGSHNKGVEFSFRVGPEQHEQWVAESELSRDQVLWCLVRFCNMSLCRIAVHMDAVRIGRQ